MVTGQKLTPTSVGADSELNSRSGWKGRALNGRGAVCYFCNGDSVVHRFSAKEDSVEPLPQSTVRATRSISPGKGPRILSLFSGAGGLDIGFETAGCRISASVESEEYACATLRRNFPGSTIVGPPSKSGDLGDLEPEDVFGAMPTEARSIDLLIGGPPCQPFSIAANQRFLKIDERFKRKGYRDGNRGGLLDRYFRYVLEVKPAAFFLENVPGIVEMDGGRRFSKMLGPLRRAGYKLAGPTVLDAVNFGVPQRRRRCFLLGVLKGPAPMLPNRIEEIPELSGEIRPRAVVHALADMNSALPNHVTREHTPNSIRRYKRLRFGEREPLGRVDRLDPRLPSKTIIAGGSNGGGRSHLHPYIARTLTVRESARLQTFPDDFVFEGSIARQFTQVGNAVPPQLAQILAYFVVRNVFDIKCTAPSPSSYLMRDEKLQVLCTRFWRESRKRKPEWLYDDSKKNDPARSAKKTRAVPLIPEG